MTPHHDHTQPGCRHADSEIAFPLTDSSPSRVQNQHLFLLLALATVATAAGPERIDVVADSYLLEAAFEIVDFALGGSWIVWSA